MAQKSWLYDIGQVAELLWASVYKLYSEDNVRSK